MTKELTIETEEFGDQSRKIITAKTPSGRGYLIIQAVHGTIRGPVQEEIYETTGGQKKLVRKLWLLGGTIKEQSAINLIAERELNAAT